MSYWQFLLLVVVSNADDLSVGFSLGLKGFMPRPLCLLIGVLSGLMMAFGLMVGGEFSHMLPAGAAAYISSAAFICFAFWFLFEGLKKEKNEKYKFRTLETFNVKHVQLANNMVAAESSKMSWKAAFVLGIALSLDSLALGFSGGMAGFPVLKASILEGTSSALFAWAGYRFGSTRFMQNLMGKKTEYVASAFMFMLAIMQLW